MADHRGAMHRRTVGLALGLASAALVLILACAALAWALAPDPLAQLSGLPLCASDALVANTGGTACHGLDFDCLCRRDAYLGDIWAQVRMACSTSAQDEALDFMERRCEEANVHIVLKRQIQLDPSSSPGVIGIEFTTEQPLLPPAPTRGPSLSVVIPTSFSTTAFSTNVPGILLSSRGSFGGGPTTILQTVGATTIILTPTSGPAQTTSPASDNGDGGGLSQGAKVGIGVGVGVGVPALAAAIVALLLVLRRRARKKRTGDGVGIAHEREPNSGVTLEKPVGTSREPR